MRSSPAFHVVLDRFGVWRAAVIGVVLAGALAMLAWFVLQPPPPAPALLRWVALFMTTIVCGLGLSLARVPPMRLRWDGQLWHLGPAETAGRELRSGSLRVIIDLGVWMLLRFEPETPGERPRAVWIPAQRRGLEASWHGLRCAVHSPRPRRAETAVADF